MKFCSKCKNTREFIYFYKKKSSKDGYYPHCITCTKKLHSLYYLENKKILKEKAIEYNNTHKKEHRLCVNRWVSKNRDMIRKYQYEWGIKNPDKIKLKYTKSNKKRNQNVTFKISSSISKGMWFSLKRNKKGRHWENLVGYTLDQLMNHLESQFTKCMLWENYGRNGWHIDHIKPQSLFKFEKPEDIEFKKCWSLNNLQPLWETTRIINGIEYLGNINKFDKYYGGVK